MKIDVGKLYRSRDGHKVRVYSLDGGGDYPVHGAIQRKDGVWRIVSLTPDGKYMTGGEEDWDIISEWAEPLDFDPSCLPVWVKHIAMDKNDKWYCYADIPEIEENRWWGRPGNHIMIPEPYAPKNFTGDWKDSLFSVNELKKQQP